MLRSDWFPPTLRSFKVNTFPPTCPVKSQSHLCTFPLLLRFSTTTTPSFLPRVLLNASLSADEDFSHFMLVHYPGGQHLVASGTFGFALYGGTTAISIESVTSIPEMLGHRRNVSQFPRHWTRHLRSRLCHQAHAVVPPMPHQTPLRNKRGPTVATSIMEVRC